MDTELPRSPDAPAAARRRRTRSTPSAAAPSAPPDADARGEAVARAPVAETLSPITAAPEAPGDWDPPRQVILAAFTREIRRTAAMAEAATEHPAEAVHGFRRALRRARAVLHLVRSALPEAQHAEVDRALTQAARRTSDFRDAEVLPAALAALAVPDRALFEPWQAELEAERERAAQGDGVAEVLREGAAELESLSATLAEGLQQDLGWAEVARGLRDSYRRARRARRTARRHPDTTLIHAFRKRAKDLRWQLELLHIGRADIPDAELESVAELTRSLGEVADLIALRTWVREQPGGTERKQVATRAIKTAIAQGFEVALSTSEAVFDEKPKRFAARARRRLELSPCAGED